MDLMLNIEQFDFSGSAYTAVQDTLTGNYLFVVSGNITFTDEDYKGIYEDVFKDFEPTLGDILPFGSSFIPGTADFLKTS